MIKTKISTVITSLILLVALCFAMASCTKQNAQDHAENELVETSALETEFLNSASVSLKAASPMMMSKGTGTISQKLTATITPSTATNKQVDWAVTWADSNNTSNVADYVIVTPDSDGSTNATVTCKAAFTGNIVITVTTRQNNYKAVCLVSFVGIPSELGIVTNLTPSNGAYPVSVGNTYTFGTELSNPLGAVGANYQNLQVSVSGKGQIKVASKEVYNNGSVKWFEDKVIDFATIASKFITATYSNNTVTLTVKKSIESYYSSFNIIDSGRTQYYQDCFREYVSDCSFEIILTEPTSGVSNSFNVLIDPNSVSAVSVDVTEMFF